MTSDEGEIRRLVATWMAATKSGDLETVLGLMTEDAVFLVAGRPPMIGKAAYAAAARTQAAHGAPKFEGTSDIREIRVLGDWAYMWTDLTVVVTPGAGKPVRRAGQTLTILRKEKGEWLLARDANLLSAQPSGGA